MEEENERLRLREKIVGAVVMVILDSVRRR
jgi:hypothetical protein